MSKGTIDQLLDTLGLGLSVSLTSEQQKALDALDWLGINGPPRTGRTVVMALHTIKTAMDNPGYKVELADHHPGPSGRDRLKCAIRHLLRRAPEEVLKRFQVGTTSLVFHPETNTRRVDITYSLSSTFDVTPPQFNYTDLIRGTSKG